ncbi:MAG: Crp/Fnr family transcriptional regulator [Bacteroidota bacterium]|nr:Crp/Fnr family transcriptional regulator [Bacteroidota bacterium]MDP3145679.1 Crp/Fnr family transcriptional regulator [Bacteroidota bacterium]MDP3558646.1 Crp/Fnr family transcriptional regulator [Bacteroidota bacterium]
MEFNIEKYHLKSTSLFDFLTPNESQLIKNKLVRMEFLKGDSLFKENSFSKGIYIVRKGKVKIFQTNSEGKESIVYFYKKGDYFGYRPLLANEPHPVSAVAMDNVVISFMPKELFSSILATSSNLARHLLIVLSKEFSVWINKMTVFSQYGVKERVALSLLILNKVYQRAENDNALNISINRDDFAGFVGTAKETLVRMLRIFKDEKIITTKGTKIIILKHKVLLDMVADM